MLRSQGETEAERKRTRDRSNYRPIGYRPIGYEGGRKVAQAEANEAAAADDADDADEA